MPKALCLVSLAASILILVLFGADAIMGMAGMSDTAPLGAASMLMDFSFIFFGALLAFLSFVTFREQR